MPPSPPPGEPPASPPPAPDPLTTPLVDRWQRGEPSSDARQAGVFITQWDSFHRANERHHTAEQLWLPCQPSDWCSWLVGRAARFEASVVNRQSPWLWDATLPGFVVAPEAVSIRCAYSGDASTQGATSGCPRGAKFDTRPREAQTPGAAAAARDGGQQQAGGQSLASEEEHPVEGSAWCVRPRSPYGETCAWREADLDEAMRQQRDQRHPYNECDAADRTRLHAGPRLLRTARSAR